MKARSHDNPHDFVLIEETRRERHAPGSPSMRLRDASDEHERRIIADDESIYDLQRAWNSDSARLLLCERTKALQVLNLAVYVNSLEVSFNVFMFAACECSAVSSSSSISAHLDSA